MVPLKEHRKKLIEQSHLLGHFGIQTTLQRLEKEYYWKNMYRQIEEYIKKCLPCIRNNPAIPLQHPAKVTIIRNLFDRIALDITGGFPMSNNGFTKILVIVEYLSKLIKLYPLKTKTAEEVAEKLWLWITTYGPPKEILTDQGTEFLNNVIEKMINKIGIERRVTSPFSPWVDGMAEKGNFTVVTALKKHAETDHNNWDLWVPFVEYAYNTRTHSVTKFPPLEIIQGVPVNSLSKNYKEDLYASEEECLFNRSKQINSLVERIRPEAIENIKTAQEKQKDTQDKRNKPTEDILKPGTPVMIKVEGLRGKLESRYRGRYFVEEQASGGNYRLKNALGEIMKQTFPISKLRPFTEDNERPEDSVEIEEILDKRKNPENDVIEYLVKWKNLSEEENEWVPEDHFDDIKKINEYNSKIHRENIPQDTTTPIDSNNKLLNNTDSSNNTNNRYELRKRIETNKVRQDSRPARGRGRGRPRRTLITPLNVMIGLFFIANLLSIAGAEKVKDKFIRCDKSTSSIVDLSQNCIQKQELTKKNLIDLNFREDRKSVV